MNKAYINTSRRCTSYSGNYMKRNDWCFRPRFCTERLYWAGDNLGVVNQMNIHLILKICYTNETLCTNVSPRLACVGYKDYYMQLFSVLIFIICMFIISIFILSYLFLTLFIPYFYFYCIHYIYFLLYYFHYIYFFYNI